MEETPTAPGPVFVGGSPRSGTHAMGQLVGAHSDYAFIALEVRFHAAKNGLADLIGRRSTLDDFLKKCRNFWFARGMKGNRGLQRIVSRERLDEALNRFEGEYEDDPIGASRRLTHQLLDPVVEEAGKRTWVEVSGANIRSGPELLRLFPDAKFINMIRDGRAVAASILHKESMTNDPMDALRKHWLKRIRDSDAAMRRMPAESVMVMRLEDLASEAREASYRRVAEFIGGDDPAMRAHFDTEITAAAAHVGQWRERMDEADAERIDQAYRQLIRKLYREGVTAAPSPAEVGVDVSRRARVRRIARLARAPRQILR